MWLSGGSWIQTGRPACSDMIACLSTRRSHRPEVPCVLIGRHNLVSTVPAEILNCIEQQSGVITEKADAGIAVCAETTTLTIRFVAVIDGQRFASSPLQFVRLKLAANVAARSTAFRPLNGRPFDRCA